MIKVLFVANRPEILSGGQVSLLELLTRIDRLQLEPVVLIPGEGEMAERVRSMGITLLLWGMPTARMLNIGVIKRKVKELRSIVREQGVDIVHTNGSRAQFYASLAVKGTKARLVWHVREAKKDIPLYDLFLAASADKIICVSKAVKNKRFGLYPWLEPKIKVIYNGVDTNRFVRDDGEGERARKDLGINGDKKFLGTIGLLIPRKGHVFLFNALKTVVKKHPDIRFLILGKTVHESYTAGLRKKVWEMGIEKNILFKEPLNDINPVLSGLDIFVLPSRSEGFSRVLIEAMSCSLPVVTTDVEGNNEAVIDGESGVLVPYGDISRLAGAIEKMIDNTAHAKEVGQNARKRVEKFFSIEKHAFDVQELYREIVATSCHD